MSDTHGKDCYYDLASGGGEPQLVGAAAWDDVYTYCNQTSFRVEAGKTTSNCGRYTEGSSVVCNGPGDTPHATGGNFSGTGAAGSGTGGAGDSETRDTRPPACFSALSHACEPC